MGTDNNRRNAIKWLGAGALALGTRSLYALSATAAPRKPVHKGAPNIIFIMTDDHAQHAMSIYGDKILNTPNLDRIGNEGIRFNRAFVTNSLCAPSRASYMTGLYSHTHGVTTNGEQAGFYDQEGLAADQITWPLLLQQAGYHTGLVGKWHIKSTPRGFDHTAILPGQGTYFDPEFLVNGGHVRFRGHTDDVIGDQAMAYLKHERPANRPFCLLYHFKAPHGPWEADPRYMDEFKDAQIPLPVAFEGPPEGAPEALFKTQNAVADMGDFIHPREHRPALVDPDLPPKQLARANLQALLRSYYRVLLGVDYNVGRVLDFLDENDLAENTIVIYGTDNGFFLGEYGFFDKRLMYEPSIKVPMLMRWPKLIRASQVDDNNMVLNVDVAPTLLELAGVPVPETMQGRSWKPLLGNQNAPWRDAFLYEYYEYPAVHCVRKHRGVRTEDWKLIHFWERPDEWALYDLKNDPNELVNLIDAQEQAQRIAELKQRLLALRVETGDVDPPGYVAPMLETGKCPA